MAGLPAKTPFSLIDLHTTEPSTTTILSPTEIPLKRTDWLPKKSLLPTLQSQFIMVRAEILLYSSIIASCSIVQKKFRMTFLSICAPVLTKGKFFIIVTLPFV